MTQPKPQRPSRTARTLTKVKDEKTSGNCLAGRCRLCFSVYCDCPCHSKPERRVA